MHIFSSVHWLLDDVAAVGGRHQEEDVEGSERVLQEARHETEVARTQQVLLHVLVFS